MIGEASWTAMSSVSGVATEMVAKSAIRQTIWKARILVNGGGSYFIVGCIGRLDVFADGCQIGWGFGHFVACIGGPLIRRLGEIHLARKNVVLRSRRIVFRAALLRDADVTSRVIVYRFPYGHHCFEVTIARRTTVVCQCVTGLFHVLIRQIAMNS